MAEMPFRRRRMRRAIRAPIVSYKHQRQEEVTYVGTTGNQEYLVYQGTQPGSMSGPQDVPAGNKVYSIDVSQNFTIESGSGTARLNWMLVHLRDGQQVGFLYAATDAANWSNIGLSKGRNQVIKSYVGIVGTEDAGPKIWNVHIPIPKLWHRVREGDELRIVFTGTDPGLLVTGTRFKSFS